MPEVISVEILNFLNFGGDEKRLVGLRQAMAAGKNWPESRSEKSDPGWGRDYEIDSRDRSRASLVTRRSAV